MLVCDTSALVAYFDASDAHCDAVTQIIEGDPGPFVISSYVVAELDYLVATRRGIDAELAVLTELAGGAWELAAISASELREVGRLIERYHDQKMGVADASLVVLAARYRTDRILTLDHRHFRVIRTAAGKPFAVLP